VSKDAGVAPRDGVLGHQLYKRLEFFAPCYLQSLLLADFKENHILLWFKKSLQKIRETRKLESIHEQHFEAWKNEVRSQIKTGVSEDSSLCLETPTKNADQEFHLRVFATLALAFKCFNYSVEDRLIH
jgi:hypothetical protein